MTKELTPLELRLMNILWDKKQVFVSDVIEAMPAPKPAYTTVSTMMRVLVQKGFADFEAFGKSHRYFPLLERDNYSQLTLRNTRDQLFGGSYGAMFSFFARKEKLSAEQIDELIEILNDAK